MPGLQIARTMTRSPRSNLGVAGQWAFRDETPAQPPIAPRWAGAGGVAGQTTNPVGKTTAYRRVCWPYLRPCRAAVTPLRDAAVAVSHEGVGLATEKMMVL